MMDRPEVTGVQLRLDVLAAADRIPKPGEKAYDECRQKSGDRRRLDIAPSCPEIVARVRRHPRRFQDRKGDVFHKLPRDDLVILEDRLHFPERDGRRFRCNGHDQEIRPRLVLRLGAPVKIGKPDLLGDLFLQDAAVEELREPGRRVACGIQILIGAARGSRTRDDHSRFRGIDRSVARDQKYVHQHSRAQGNEHDRQPLLQDVVQNAVIVYGAPRKEGFFIVHFLLLTKPTRLFPVRRRKAASSRSPVRRLHSPRCRNR